ncbi:MAG: hypothetical protein ACTSV2_11495 [Candidatus Thorarchaeota archaeon]
MSKNKDCKFNTLHLEISISYPFPFIVVIFSLFIIAGLYSLVTMPMYGMDLYIPKGWNSTIVTEELATSIRKMTTQATVYSMLSGLYIVLMLLPVIIGFNLASGINSGQIQTLLSYPIGREKLILVKTGLVFVLVSGSLTTGSLFSLLFFYPFSIDLASLCLLNITLWITLFLITSTCVFIAVISKSALMTVITGTGGWVIAFMIFMTPSTPSHIRNLLFPVLIAMNHINPGFPMMFLEGISMFDIFIASGAAIAIGCLLMYFSIMLFKRLEI